MTPRRPEIQPEMLRDDVAGIARAAQVLARGGLLGLPTETVYGLAADARNPAAVARIFAAKGRPAVNPLIVHLASVEAAAALAHLSSDAERLAEAFWPGALTLVLPVRPGAVAPAVTAGLPTLALRVPAHPLARAVLAEFGGPVAAPSANPSGLVSPTTAAHVVAGLGARIDAVLDGGPCAVGVESTIVAPGDGPSGPARLLREGGIPREAIEACLGRALACDLTPGRLEAPGQMERHYATRTPLILGGAARAGEVAVGFGRAMGELTLSASGDPAEAAGRLYAVLHAADALAAARGAPAIRVSPIPDQGLGRAVNDRLRRAATPGGGGDGAA